MKFLIQCRSLTNSGEKCSRNSTIKYKYLCATHKDSNNIWISETDAVSKAKDIAQDKFRARHKKAIALRKERPLGDEIIEASRTVIFDVNSLNRPIPKPKKIKPKGGHSFPVTVTYI